MSDYYWNPQSGLLSANEIFVNTFTVDTISTTGPVSIGNSIKEYSGSSGTLYYDVPFVGSSYKKIILYADNFSNSNVITISIPTFTNLPAVVANVSGLNATFSTTTLTINTNTTAVTGFTILEGY